jgi:hypothetical protein
LFVVTDRVCLPVWIAIFGMEPDLLFARSDRALRARVLRAKERKGVG